MSSHKRIELLANISIIVVAILLGVVLVRGYLLSGSPKSDAAESAPIKPGTKLPLTGVDWQRSDKTLLLVLSTNCHFCSESAPFYQRLTQQKAGRGDVRLIAVLPQSADEARKYLDDRGIPVDEIKQAAPGATHTTGTPTLIMVDRTGSVVESWIGKLTPEKEVEVLNRFLGQRSGG